MAPGVVLASATSPTEQAVFNELVHRGVERSRLSAYRPPGDDRIVHAWPLPLADHVDTSGLTAGDYVLFYRGHNRYSWAAQVKAVETDTDEISDVLTSLVVDRGSGSIQPGEEFSDAVLYLDIPVPIELESYRLHDLLGIDQEALTRTVIPGADAIANLEDEFGSLKGMIRTTRKAPSVFVEVTSVEDKPYKEPDGEFALGSAVFSRSQDAKGRQIYETLREPEVGDLVLHVRKDTRELVGVSTVASTLQEDFEGPPDDSWPPEARGKGYFRPLGNYRPFDDPPDIDLDLLQNEDYRDRLQDIYSSTQNLFYDKNFELAQGAYFTEIPLEFLHLCIAEYPDLVTAAEHRYWSVPIPDPVDRYDTVTAAVVDIKTKLPFGERGQDWFHDAFTDVVIREFTNALSKVEPNSVLTEREAAFISLVNDVYEGNADAFETAADRLGIGRTNQVSPAQTLFSVLFRGLQSRVGVSPNMNQVKTKVILNNEYEVEAPTPDFDLDDDADPLLERPMPSRGEDIARQLTDAGQMVFYGPPGTGKTYTAEQFARWWLNQQPGVDPTTGQLETVTFHPSFTYEDFIEGLSVDTNEEGQVSYDEQAGVFLDFANKAKQAYYAAGDEPAPRYVMVIDEINRGNLAQIFGEMITALEMDKRLDGDNEVKISLSHSGDTFSIPPNLYLIGTMNTADRSIALVDAALRRRFRFLSFPPEFGSVMAEYGLAGWRDVEAAARTSGDDRLLAQSLIAVNVLNDRIRDQPDLGRGKQIGHSFFYGLSSDQDIVDMWRFEILPLLEEYLFGQYERIRDSLFSGDGEQLFDWEHQQIKHFDAAALESALGAFVKDHVEDTGGVAVAMSVLVPSDDAEITADIELGEYEESDPTELSEQAARMLTQEVNGGADRDGERIKLRYTREGKAILKATQYVGLISLRNGPVIQVRPKAAGTNLLYLLQYAQDSTVSTYSTETPLQRGPTFLDAFGALFEAELREVLNSGLQTDYRRVSGTESHLRGQLNVQQQLQRQPPTPTKFECTYDELTHDTIANRAILYATSVLLGVISDRSITQSLRQHQQLLRQRVELVPVASTDLDGIQLTRLSEHYEDILRLSRMVIENSFVGELLTGSSTSYSLLVNMNTVFENAVERAVTGVGRERGWTVKPQDMTQSLLTRGKHNVTLKPDVTIYGGDGEPVIVGDAKWKTDTPSNSDYYQLTSYMLGRDAPGVLFYPDCGGDNATTAEVAGKFSLEIFELPTGTPADGFEEFVDQFESAVRTAINTIHDV